MLGPWTTKALTADGDLEFTGLVAHWEDLLTPRLFTGWRLEKMIGSNLLFWEGQITPTQANRFDFKCWWTT